MLNYIVNFFLQYRQLIVTATYKYLGKILGFILAVLLARNLDANSFGYYSYLMSIVAIFMIMPTSGLVPFLVRKFNDDHNQLRETSQLNGFILMWVILFSILSIFLLNIVVDFKNKYLIFIMTLYLLVRILMQVNSAYFISFKNSSFAQIGINIIYPFVFIIAIYITKIFKNLDVGIVISLALLALIFSYLIVMVKLLKEHKLQFTILENKLQLIPWVKSLSILTFSAGLTVLLIEIPLIYAGNTLSMEDVAYFRIGVSLILPIAIPLAAVNNVYGPIIALAFNSGDKKSFQDAITKSVRISVLTSLPMIVIVFLFAEDLIHLFYGNQYTIAVEVTKVLLIGQLFNILCGSVGLILNMSGREVDSMNGILLVILFMIILLPILSTFYGIVGVAVSSSLALGVWNIIMLIRVKMKLGVVACLK